MSCVVDCTGIFKGLGTGELEVGDYSGGLGNGGNLDRGFEDGYCDIGLRGGWDFSRGGRGGGEFCGDLEGGGGLRGHARPHHGGGRRGGDRGRDLAARSWGLAWWWWTWRLKFEWGPS